MNEDRQSHAVLEVEAQWFSKGTLTSVAMRTSEAAATLADFPPGTKIMVTVTGARIEPSAELSA